MSALMGKGKSTLTAELAYLTGLDEALVQKDLISFEWNGRLLPISSMIYSVSAYVSDRNATIV